jgi:hypothetical protein
LVCDRLGWPLHIRSVASLSDHEQQLTLICASAATLFVWSVGARSALICLGALIDVFENGRLAGGGGTKSRATIPAICLRKFCVKFLDPYSSVRKYIV